MIFLDTHRVEVIKITNVSNGHAKIYMSLCDLNASWEGLYKIIINVYFHTLPISTLQIPFQVDTQTMVTQEQPNTYAFTNLDYCL